MGEDDIFCAKNRMSGLWCEEQPLWKVLTGEHEGDVFGENGEGKEKGNGKEMKWDTILFAGVNTDQCVLGTLVDGYNKGLNCVLIDDCCGTTTVGARKVCVGNVAVSDPLLYLLLAFLYFFLVWLVSLRGLVSCSGFVAGFRCVRVLITDRDMVWIGSLRLRYR